MRPESRWSTAGRRRRTGGDLLLIGPQRIAQVMEQAGDGIGGDGNAGFSQFFRDGGSSSTARPKHRNENQKRTGRQLTRCPGSEIAACNRSLAEAANELATANSSIVRRGLVQPIVLPRQYFQTVHLFNNFHPDLVEAGSRSTRTKTEDVPTAYVVSHH